MSELLEIRRLAQQLFFLAEAADCDDAEGAVLPPRRSQNQSSKPTQRVCRAEPETYTDVALAQLAKCLLSARLRRERLLPAQYFGEGAWNMLLDLFINRVRGIEVHITSLCVASNLPLSTALRWVQIIVDDGFVMRRESELDRRVCYVSLTDEGFVQMRRVLYEQMVEMGPVGAMILVNRNV